MTTNVVVLMTDQHAHNFMGCAGYPGLRTRTFDRLAADGVRFEQATCAITPCLPSRHTILHGQYAFQTGVYSNGHLLPTSEIPRLTMGKIFREAGYQTAAFGKMHPFPYHAPVERGNHLGFDRRAGHFHETGESMETHFAREFRDIQEKRIAERTAHGVGKGGDDCAAAFLGYTSDLRSDQTPDAWCAAKAAAFIDEHAAEPFFLICSLPGPHAPHAVPRDFADLYDAQQVQLPPEPPDNLPDAEAYQTFAGLTREDLKVAIANYMACVSACDACHAQVIDALDRNGMYDETLIVFLSDHGELLGSRGVQAFSKYCLYEQAIRVPLIIKPPASMDSPIRGQVGDTLVSLVDLFPTLLDLTGLENSESLPGISLRPLLGGGTPTRERQVQLTEFWWNGKVHLSIRTQDWKLIHGPYGEEFYCLAEDPFEFHNLAQDSNHATRIAALRGMAIDEFREAFNRSASPRTSFERQEWGTLS